MADLYAVYTAYSQYEADLVAALLRADGLQPSILDMNPEVNFGGSSPGIDPVLVRVPEPELERARLVVKRMEKAKKARGKESDPSLCPACSVPWEPGFDVCWNCQHALQES